jgi:hypothetical protein
MLLSILVVLMFAAVFPLALYDYSKDWISYLRSLYKTSVKLPNNHGYFVILSGHTPFSKLFPKLFPKST